VTLERQVQAKESPTPLNIVFLANETGKHCHLTTPTAKVSFQDIRLMANWMACVLATNSLAIRINNCEYFEYDVGWEPIL
jgi:hypothetical protein